MTVLKQQLKFRAINYSNLF